MNISGLQGDIHVFETVCDLKAMRTNVETVYLSCFWYEYLKMLYLLSEAPVPVLVQSQCTSSPVMNWDELVWIHFDTKAILLFLNNIQLWLPVHTWTFIFWWIIWICWHGFTWWTFPRLDWKFVSTSEHSWTAEIDSALMQINSGAGI